jgi:hypothetical protein
MVVTIRVEKTRRGDPMDLETWCSLKWKRNRLAVNRSASQHAKLVSAPSIPKRRSVLRKSVPKRGSNAKSPVGSSRYNTHNSVRLRLHV